MKKIITCMSVSAVMMLSCTAFASEALKDKIEPPAAGAIQIEESIRNTPITDEGPRTDKPAEAAPKSNIPAKAPIADTHPNVAEPTDKTSSTPKPSDNNSVDKAPVNHIPRDMPNDKAIK
ncbi:hypothetical protein [Anaerovibrio lipolyticus]|uniref:hypothetical protein n=1 Tax=Anaerovibrio lipolyticus TaxID=82374 RepID=UPI0026EAC0F1|nr:hypothetical protein [Anaerovibrio lipolyticus]